MIKKEYKTIQNIPCFSHLKKSEILFLENNSKKIIKNAGSIIDLKKNNGLYIVLDGVLELQSGIGKGESVFLAKNDFFGDIPFTEKKSRSILKVLVDCCLLEIKTEDVYKLFLSSYKAARGYIKSIDLLGFKSTTVSRKHFQNNTKVITLCGGQRKSGKTTLAALISTALESEDRVILLDISYSGNSVFNILEKKMTPPISAKEDSESSKNENLIYERIVDISENLSLLNIAFGSKVKMNPGIISPILFLLSKNYKYIVIDLGGQDHELEEEIYNCSDYILPVCKNKKDIIDLYSKFDEILDDAQRVYYLLNTYFAKNIKKIDGGYLIDNLDLNKKTDMRKQFQELSENISVKNIVSNFIGQKSSLILNSHAYESIAYGGLFSFLSNANISFDYIFSSYITSIVSAFYIYSHNNKEMLKLINKFFKSERIESLLDVTFPQKNIFKKDKVYKFFNDIFKNQRVENYNVSVVTRLADSNDTFRIFSSGYLSKIVSAAFLYYPLFDPVKIGGKYYHSGAPYLKSSMPDVLRTDAEKFVNCNFEYEKGLSITTEKLPFYSDYLKFHSQNKNIESCENNYGNNIVIDVNFENNKNNLIIKHTEEKWGKAFKEKNII